jgi:hypothetical protein
MHPRNPPEMLREYPDQRDCTPYRTLSWLPLQTNKEMCKIGSAS